MSRKRTEVNYQQYRVPTEQLCWRCELVGLNFRTTDELKVSSEIVGQRRAVDALSLGLEIESAGYNIFVTGPAGTGRTTTVQKLLERKPKGVGELFDSCYVNNFNDPDQPRLLRLPAGKGRQFQRAIDEVIGYLVKTVPTLFESDTYQQRRQSIIDGFKERGSSKVRDFEKRIAAEGFALVQTAPFQRPELAPIIEKQPVRIDALDTLVDEGRLTPERARELKEKHQELTLELTAIFKEVREFEREARAALEELDRNIIQPVLEERLDELAERFGERVGEYLAQVKKAIMARIELFQQRPQEKPQTEPAGDPYLEFRVNVLVDNSDVKTAPVVFETNPSYRNLFGSIERVWDRSGQWRTDFTRIKAGSILRADGGFLVLNALDVLLEPGVWPALKRTLRNQRLEITAYDPFYALFGTSALKPEPIPINLKVIMIGDPLIYSLLAAYDEEFKKVFKVRADFDWTMPRNRNTVREYAQVIKALCTKEGLRPFDRSGVQRVVEFGVRLAGRQTKLSTRFNIITEILKEANYWAGKSGSKTVTSQHVEQAIEKRRDRMRLYEEKIQEAINEGTIFIDVKGKVIGQVNGLAVYDTGEYAFGKPVRITAKTGVGSAGIINIEREAQLSGPTHDKGVYIISGYLRRKYAQDQPLALSASICFEQSYGGIDGDSASSTELYALLSDLSGVPIRQDLAVTGSVNQLGQIQPIGGVNWKIEGFFDTCKARGLTGTQGVIIPKANLPDLMLRRDVIEAVAKGKFHIYAVATIDEGIELLTGVQAGRPDAQGNYPADSVHGRVKARLRELAQLFREFQEERHPEKEPPRQRAKPEKQVLKKARRTACR
ncbi:MAG: ATP-binding protein [candidate division WOR-3 bacterium]